MKPGPVLGGWLTEHVSWHYAFYSNLPIGIGLLGLLFVGLPTEPLKLAAFRDTDYLGIGGLVLGMGGLTTVLEEGQRERWFESSLIVGLSALSLVGFGMLLAGQFVAKNPVIRLRIILERQFGGVFLMTMVLGAALYGILYLIPQFLAQVPGYNAEQSGFVAAISGVLTIAMMATFPFLIKHLDVRIAVGFGFLLYAVSCFLNSALTPFDTGDSFLAGQLIRGVAMFFAMFFLNQAATSSVSRDYADDASGLFNAARNLGGSVGLAIIGTLQDRRETLHFARLAESLPANAEAVQSVVQSQGLAAISESLSQQATVMTFSDLFWLFGIALLAIIPLVLVMKPFKAEA